MPWDCGARQSRRIITTGRLTQSNHYPMTMLGIGIRQTKHNRHQPAEGWP